MHNIFVLLRVGFFPGVQVFPKSNLDTSKTLINFPQNIIGAEVFLFYWNEAFKTY